MMPAITGPLDNLVSQDTQPLTNGISMPMPPSNYMEVPKLPSTDELMKASEEEAQQKIAFNKPIIDAVKSYNPQQVPIDAQAWLKQNGIEEKKPEALHLEEPMSAFTNIVPALAALLGSFSKQPILGFMSAATGAMQGIKEGNQNKIDLHTKQLDEYNKQHQQNMELFKSYQSSIIDNNKMNYEKLTGLASLLGKSDLLAKPNGPQQIIDAAKTAVDINDKMALGVSRYSTAFQRYNQSQYSKKTLEGTIADPSASDDQKAFAKKALQEISQSEKGMAELTDDVYESQYKNDPEIQRLASEWHKGVLVSQIVPGYGKEASVRRAAVEKKGHELWPDFNWADAAMARQVELTREKNLVPQATRIQLASNMLDRSLPSMMEAAKKLNLSNSTDLNTLYNMAKRHFSNQDFANFSTQLRAVTSDYAQFIGRGRITVHSDEEALRILNEAMGEPSLQGFIDAVGQERDNVKGGVEDTQANKWSQTGMPMPSNKKELSKGTVYNTARGLAKWNGEAFEAVDQ